MADVHTREQRSRNMRAIRHKDTKPEIILRQLLHARGFRYRLHVKDLPGKPDIVLPKYRAVIMVHGCFWHKHNCYLFKLPKTRPGFWEAKIDGNYARDIRARMALREQGWRVLIVWECALKGRLRQTHEELSSAAETWLNAATAAAGYDYAELRCVDADFGLSATAS